MSRLTRKIKGCYCVDLRTCLPMEYEQIENSNACVDKLGKLEDIEEELGCPLKIVFKALKQMFVFRKENVKIKIELLGLYIHFNELHLYGFVEDTTHAVYLSLKDYGKTWALTKEELENDN